jgi:hypothetical protein
MAFAIPGGRKQAARKITPTEPESTEAFQGIVDYAALNAGMHQASRTDTFRTPSRLTPSEERQPMVRTSNSMEGVYRRSSPKSQRSMHNISEDVQDLHEATLGIRKQLTESWEREAVMAEMLAQMNEKVHFMHSKAVKTAREAENTKIDLQPVYNALAAFETRNAEKLDHLMQQVETRISQNLSKVREELAEMSRQSKETEDVHFVQVVESMRKSEASLKKDISEMAMEIVNSSNEGKMLKSGDGDDTARVVSVLEKQDARQTRLNNDHFERMMVQFRSTQGTAHTDCATILSELVKIQQALNVDFAQIVGELKDMNNPNHEQENEDPDGADGNPTEMKRTDTSALDIAELTQDEKPHAIALSKRYRHFWCQTDDPTTLAEGCQTDDSLLKDAGYIIDAGSTKRRKKKNRQTNEPSAPKNAGPAMNHKAVFADAEEMKRKMRQQLLSAQHHVTDYYWDHGVFQAIATSWTFEHFTLLVILCNAIWIAVDTDMNNEEVLYNAHPVFIIAENFFCTYFTLELFIRFMAFRRKRFAMRDFWFIFDGMLVFLMVIETWLINGLMMVVMGDSASSGTGNASILRMVRMVRMLRISRMARLLRSIPELVVLIKGIKAASRSVVIFFLLWFIIIYVFAVMFKQLTYDHEIGKQYFDSVPAAMNTLLLYGILPNHTQLVNDLTGANPWLFPVIMFFIGLAAITVMYMLVGVLVDVITVIANAEKEGMTVSSLAGELRHLFHVMGRSMSEPITQFELRSMLQDGMFCQILHSVQVDVIMLFEMLDIVYEDEETKAVGLPFEKFIDLILGMRGSNAATVKDVKELLKVTKKMLNTTMEEFFRKIQDELCVLQKGIHQLEEDILEGDESASPSDVGDATVGYILTEGSTDFPSH